MINEKLLQKYIIAIKNNFIEPTEMERGNPKVLVNGKILKVNYRIIAEEYYQLFMFLLDDYVTKAAKQFNNKENN